ncbi:60S acidic ribosomal protein P2-like protein [Cricetulus griseus]|nr:60S acidic ribosomal protein P2-like protein [Cricetulus griseus]
MKRVLSYFYNQMIYLPFAHTFPTTLKKQLHLDSFSHYLIAKDIKKILDSVVIEVDDDWLNKIISELNGKNTEDVIAQGIGKFASVPAGGAVAVSAAPGSAAPAASSAPAAEEKKD